MQLEKMSLDELAELKEKITRIEAEKLSEFRGKEVLGFKLSEVNSKDSKSGKKYASWKAYLCQDGKRHVVHVGSDPRKAEDKIKKYLEKYPQLANIF